MATNQLLPIHFDSLFHDTTEASRTFQLAEKRCLHFESAPRVPRETLFDFRTILDEECKRRMEKQTFDQLYEEWILDTVAKLLPTFQHGCVIECERRNKTKEKLKIWFPGLPVLTDQIGKMHPANLFVLTNEKTSKEEINSNPTILTDSNRWIYAYLTDKDQLNRIIEFSEDLLDSFFSKFRKDADRRTGNRIEIRGIPIPFWPPHKYNVANTTTTATTTPKTIVGTTTTVTSLIPEQRRILIPQIIHPPSTTMAEGIHFYFSHRLTCSDRRHTGDRNGRSRI